MVDVKSRMVFVRGMHRGKFPYSNSLIVKGSRGRVLIDAGAGFQVLSKIRDRVDAVVITHLHVDHFSNIKLFRGKRVYVPEGDSTYTSLEQLALRYAGEVSGEWLRFVREFVGVEDPFYTDTYASNDSLSLGDVELRFIHTPGHTRSHHAIVIDESVIHGGDIDLTSFGPWFGHLECDVGEFLESIVRLASLKPELYISGHRDPVCGTERVLLELKAYVERLEEKMLKLLSVLEEPRSMEQLLRLNIVYRRKPYARRLLDYWEKNMIMHMLRYMRERGAVEMLEDGRWVRRSSVGFDLAYVKRRINL